MGPEKNLGLEKNWGSEKKLGPEEIFFDPEKRLGKIKNVGQILLHFSNIGVKMRLNAENQLPTCPGSGLKVCGGV